MRWLSRDIKKLDKVGGLNLSYMKWKPYFAVIEDGARWDLEQPCRPPYPKTWSLVTEVLLADLGLALLQNLQAQRFHSFCGQFVPVVS